MEINNAVTILHVGKLITPQRECLCVVHSLSAREALIRATLPLEAGQSVTLGLRNGFSVPAIVAVFRGEQALLMFEEHVSISTILAEQRNGRDERGGVRLNISMPVSVTTPTGRHSCAMKDISLSGMMIQDDAALLEEGMQVEILIDGLGKRDATVCWRSAPHAGLSFHVPLGFKLLDQWAAQLSG
ncbi:PilZ domain-containing protein [Sphingobium sp.]|uniref:PilZ domain-containing protein n=1 Tax=Sphingobium sp. TaxID=1912891 RepID=UPI0028BD28ED|nr:PilZ domain-containing protein [Sphingobium sp.]